MSVLSARGVGFAYEGGAGFALADVSLDVAAGDLIAVLGPNGAGKSSLLRLLGGIAAPSSGEVLLDGRPMRGLSAREIAAGVAWVPQELETIFPMTVEDAVALGRYCRGTYWGRRTPADRREIHRALEDADLAALRHRPLDRLSGGERRRVLLARALAQGPRALLLDEPTAHLDPRHQADLVRTIERLRRERRLAVVAVLHDVPLAHAWCPRALVLSSGRAVAQGPTEAVLTPERLRAVYGLSAVLGSRGAGDIRFDYFEDRDKETL